jgi:hypothetical protein
MGSRRGRSIWLCVVALAAGGADLSGCSSQALPEATGGSTGSVSGAGGHLFGVGGSGVGGRLFGVGGTGVGGTGVGGFIGDVSSPGSCILGHVNPDAEPGGACAADCQSVACNKNCTEDCCVACGIDASGTKICSCPNAGLPYSNCVCAPPVGFPSGLQGGPCNPQGYASTAVPVTAPAGAISLRGRPCRAVNLVCFTAESTAASERGCICLADGLMHCGSVSHWFVNDGVPADWMPL